MAGDGGNDSVPHAFDGWPRRIWYIDAVKGDDILGDGSQAHPWKSFDAVTSGTSVGGIDVIDYDSGRGRYNIHILRPMAGATTRDARGGSKGGDDDGLSYDLAAGAPCGSDNDDLWYAVPRTTFIPWSELMTETSKPEFNAMLGHCGSDAAGYWGNLLFPEDGETIGGRMKDIFMGIIPRYKKGNVTLAAFWLFGYDPTSDTKQCHPLFSESPSYNWQTLSAFVCVKF
jgi:hypothetical protein